MIHVLREKVLLMKGSIEPLRSEKALKYSTSHFRFLIFVWSILLFFNLVWNFGLLLLRLISKEWWVLRKRPVLQLLCNRRLLKSRNLKVRSLHSTFSTCIFVITLMSASLPDKASKILATYTQIRNELVEVLQERVVKGARDARSNFWKDLDELTDAHDALQITGRLTSVILEKHEDMVQQFLNRICKFQGIHCHIVVTAQFKECLHRHQAVAWRTCQPLSIIPYWTPTSSRQLSTTFPWESEQQVLINKYYTY